MSQSSRTDNVSEEQKQSGRIASQEPVVGGQQAAAVAAERHDNDLLNIMVNAMKGLSEELNTSGDMKGLRMIPLIRSKKNPKKLIQATLKTKLKSQSTDAIFNFLHREIKDGNLMRMKRKDAREALIKRIMDDPEKKAELLSLITISSDVEDAQKAIKKRERESRARDRRVERLKKTREEVAASGRETAAKTPFARRGAEAKEAARILARAEAREATTPTPTIGLPPGAPVESKSAAPSQQKFVPVSGSSVSTMRKIFKEQLGLLGADIDAFMKMISSKDPAEWASNNPVSIVLASLQLAARLSLVPNLPPFVITALGMAQPLIARGLKDAHGFTSSVLKDDGGLIEQFIEMTVGDVVEEAKQRVEAKVADSMATTRGIIVNAIAEGKASPAHLERFNSIVENLAVLSFDEVPDSVISGIIRTPNAIDIKRLDSHLSTLGSKFGRLAKDPVKRKLFDNPDNKQLLKDPSLLRASFNSIQNDPEFKDLTPSQKVEEVLLTFSDGKNPTPEAYNLAAQFMGAEGAIGGTVVAVKRMAERLSDAAYASNQRAGRTYAMVAAALAGGLSSLASGADPGTSAMVGALSGAGALAGVAGTQAVGLSGVAGGVAGSIAAGVSGHRIFKEKIIEAQAQAAAAPTEDAYQDQQAQNASAGTLKPKFVVPSVKAFMPTRKEINADRAEFDMFDFIRPTAEGDGYTMAESNMKKSAYRNYQLRQYGSPGFTYAPMWFAPNEDQPPTQLQLRAEMIGSKIPFNQLNLPSMELNLGEYELEEHDWDPNVPLQRAYAPQQTPIIGLDDTINESLLYGIVA